MQPKAYRDDDFFWLGFGSHHSLSSEEPETDPAEEVRKVAEEVTGKSFAKPKRTIGFI